MRDGQPVHSQPWDRSQDSKLFVYSRVSASTEPTEYSTRPSDLGVGALIEGITGTLLR